MLTMSVFHQFTLAWSAYALAAASPGPGVMAIIATSIRSGRQAGLALALGVLSGSISWAVLTTLGVSALVQAAPGTMKAIQVLGGLYLLWLAYGAMRRSLKTETAQAGRASDETVLRRHYIKGYGIHLTNPKAILAWIMLASLALPQGAPFGLTVVFVLGCLLIGLTIFGGFALIFSIPAVHDAYLRLRRPIEAAVALLFCLAALTLLRAAL